MKDTGQIKSVNELLKASLPVKLVNLITIYRTIMFPVILVFVFLQRQNTFAILLVVSFLTDAIDGFLARKLKVSSILGSRLDSMGDDLTLLAAIIGLLVFKLEFLRQEIVLVSVQLVLFALQLIGALIRYGKITSFHTYLAKTAAVLQGFFLCSMFIFDTPLYWLFYLATFFTIVELIEECILVALLPKWKSDVKGLYWVIRKS